MESDSSTERGNLAPANAQFIAVFCSECVIYSLPAYSLVTILLSMFIALLMKNLNESERSIFLKLFIIPAAASIDQPEETTKQECIGLYEELRVDTTSAAITIFLPL